jgi:hypothetical protein
MPFYAMLDRLRVFLRSGQSVLITCGYSFADEHINAFIGQGLAGNPNASCLAMIWNDRQDAPKAIELAKRHANLSVLAADGGIIGTVDRAWDSDAQQQGHAANQIAIGRNPPAGRTNAPKGQSVWLLGDFAKLGELLAYQLSSRDVERVGADAA